MNVDEATVLITGATDGLGRQVATDLAAQGATVLLHGRSDERGEETMRAIRKETGSDKLGWYRADLSSLDEVLGLADRVQEEHDRLDVLINNAGAGVGQSNEGRQESKDGHELRFAVNYLAPYLLTRSLLPLLQTSEPSRVVNVASAGQAPIDFDDVMLEGRYSGNQAYSQSKVALIMFTFDLATELEGTGVTVNALHPASLMPTKIVLPVFGSSIATLEEGAEATERLAISPDVEGVSGRYFDGRDESRANAQTYDEQARARLRRLSEELTGLGQDSDSTEVS